MVALLWAVSWILVCATCVWGPAWRDSSSLEHALITADHCIQEPCQVAQANVISTNSVFGYTESHGEAQHPWVKVDSARSWGGNIWWTIIWTPTMCKKYGVFREFCNFFFSFLGNAVFLPSLLSLALWHINLVFYLCISGIYHVWF